MEKEAAKRRERDDDVGSGSDRISELPEAVLHHILCFLSQKKAVQTCVLSKSWRHLGPTRPVINLRGICRCLADVVCEHGFDGNNRAFLSVLDNTFQRYHHQNLSPLEFRLHMLYLDYQSYSVLQKWIPIFIKPKSHVTRFSLSVDDYGYGKKPDSWTYLDLSAVFTAESLRELYLEGYRLKDINSIVLRNLRNLYLQYVCIDGETLEKIMSGCPLLEYASLIKCKGLETFTIIADNNHYLKDFEFSRYHREEKSIEHSIEIDIPTLQSIRIIRCSKWYHNHSYFPHLKTLYLSHVKLSAKSFDELSCNFPLLEDLTLRDCRGFEEIKLSSRSIKRLIIDESRTRLIKKVAIEVPNILYFEFSSTYNFPTTFSLTTSSKVWKSYLNLPHCLYNYDDVLPRILMLTEMVKALSPSQISLRLSETINSKRNQIEWDFNDHPVVVEKLGLVIYKIYPDLLTRFLNGLFRTFRPRYTDAVCVSGNNDEEVSKFLWKTLIHEREKTEYGWGQHLEEVSIEASDEEGEAWHHVQWTSLPEWSKNQKIRFRLKWRD